MVYSRKDRDVDDALSIRALFFIGIIEKMSTVTYVTGVDPNTLYERLELLGEG